MELVPLYKVHREEAKPGDGMSTDNLSLGTLSKKKRYHLGIFPNMEGGVFPNPKTFVNLPSIFLYAKFILRC